MTYFVIHATEDGDVHITPLSKDELEARLNDQYWGDAKIFDCVPDLALNAGLIIVKGEVVVPRSVKVVEKVELP